MRSHKEANKIMDLARELWMNKEITEEQLRDVYYHNFIKPL
jgi:hypothetical protein